MNIGWGELVVIFAIVLLVVGAKRVPDVGRALGQAIREFQDALRGAPEKREGGHKQEKH